MSMKPIVLAMLICDYYYRDIHTGKSILSGTFSSINSAGFPSKHGNCAVYIALTDVAADSQAQLIFRKESGTFSMSMPPWEVKRSDNRRAVVEIGGNINGLPLPEEGEYEFVLLWNGMEIAHRRMTAVRIGMEPELGQNPLEDYSLL
ncbi:MAG: hypothetical protein LBC70_04290 [Chitinispirillales bacterium]|nr:hypothetical protein [Chitinispirillales bacterium]